MSDFKYIDHIYKQKDVFKNNPKFNIDEMYERVFTELGLQQSKRDQLITIYLAAFAFIFPSLLSAEKINWIINGAVFIGLGLIGFLFALIIIRYRIYKEVYWHCCRTLCVMMDIDESKWTKENLQSIFYNCMYKKFKGFLDENEKFLPFKFFKKNIFSSETLYIIIHSIIANCVLGFGVGILVPLSIKYKILIGAFSALLLLFITMFLYFKSLKKVYQVCIDKTDESFNDTYKNAWFLHFFISRLDEDKENK